MWNSWHNSNRIKKIFFCLHPLQYKVYSETRSPVLWENRKRRDVRGPLLRRHFLHLKMANSNIGAWMYYLEAVNECFGAWQADYAELRGRETTSGAAIETGALCGRLEE